jgi:hypothetical protein
LKPAIALAPSQFITEMKTYGTLLIYAADWLSQTDLQTTITISSDEILIATAALSHNLRASIGSYRLSYTTPASETSL